MYLKVNCNLKFPAIGLKLAPDATPESFEHDFENVYEWMYVNIQGISFALNVSRSHGWADVDEELLDIHFKATQEEPKSRVKPGPVYIFGWDRAKESYIDELPEWLPQFVADRLFVDVFVYTRRINLDVPDGIPIAVIHPQCGNRKYGSSEKT